MIQAVETDYDLKWAKRLESRTIYVKWSTTHGDLHGGNIMLDDTNRPALIDFNDIGQRPAVFDWITLELSLIFNIKGPAKETAWPTLQQCENWADLDSFVEGSPFEGFVRTCRAKALLTCTGERELWVVAYAYLLRQFRYDDTDKERLKALIDGVWLRLQVL